MAPTTRKRNAVTRQASHSDLSLSEASVALGSESEASEPSAKKRKITSKAKTAPRIKFENKKPWGDVLNPREPEHHTETTRCLPPTRQHSLAYHRPLLLDNKDSRDVLLSWFDSVSTSRSMPWRKAWLDPSTIQDTDELRSALAVRAYEVWISEIMLQQTRVAVVIDYWKRWMTKWPTIHDLAAAGPDDVLAAWRGLGYYSRATRIHTAAKLVVGDEKMNGLLPDDVRELEKKVPGVGRYTAGAVTAIVFGRAEPMVDGNVVRVLSRQLGLFSDFKAKNATELIWDAADTLVKAVARDETGGMEDKARVAHVSNRPGRWGQALMELGSTVCTPKPNCSACPVTSTCHAYGEGLLLAKVEDETTEDRHQAALLDIEDLCTLCSPMPEEADNVLVKKPKVKAIKESISKYFNKREEAPAKPTDGKLSSQALEAVVNYAARFPAKAIKKAVRVEETIVCAIRRPDGQYLIQKRPDKGLLAGLWELPSHLIPEPSKATPQSRKKMAQTYVSGLLKSVRGNVGGKYVAELGSVPWLFSHIRLTMHVYTFVVDEDVDEAPASARWETADKIDEESMGTGMRKCWALVKESE